MLRRVLKILGRSDLLLLHMRRKLLLLLHDVLEGVSLALEHSDQVVDLWVDHQMRRWLLLGPRQELAPHLQLDRTGSLLFHRHGQWLLLR